MNKNDFLWLFHFPNSSWGLRYRASKLPEGNPYRSLLEALAKGLNKGILTRRAARDIIERARAGDMGDAVSKLEKLVDDAEKRRGIKHD